MLHLQLSSKFDPFYLCRCSVMPDEFLAERWCGLLLQLIPLSPLVPAVVPLPLEVLMPPPPPPCPCRVLLGEVVGRSADVTSSAFSVDSPNQTLGPWPVGCNVFPERSVSTVHWPTPPEFFPLGHVLCEAGKGGMYSDHTRG